MEQKRALAFSLTPKNDQTAIQCQGLNDLQWQDPHADPFFGKLFLNL